MPLRAPAYALSPRSCPAHRRTARVYDNQIPGGQFSNLYAQWKDMHLHCTWDEVLDMYRDVNRLFGDIIKVTPSSKCVGDSL